MIRQTIIKHVPYLENHAVSICKMSNGGLLCVWFAGSKEGKNDVSIWGTKTIEFDPAKNGYSWEIPQVICKINDEPHWNPVLFCDKYGRIRLFFKVGRTIAHWKTYISTSCDNAHSWSEPIELVRHDSSGGRGPVKNKPILLENGTLLAPSSTEQGLWRPFVDSSDIECLTWKKSKKIRMTRDLSLVNKGKPKYPGAIQPSLWESERNHVHMLLRTNCSFIYRSDSCDGGNSWCEAYKTTLPNNNSGIDLTVLTDKTIVLVSNADGGNWGTRRRLVIRFSMDNGETWSAAYLLENKDTPSEFSYPAIISDADDTIIIAYTYNRKNIAFVSGRKEEFMKLEIANI